MSKEEKLPVTSEEIQPSNPQPAEQENGADTISQPLTEKYRPSKRLRAVQRTVIVLLVAVIAATALLIVLPQTRGPFMSWVRKGREVYHVYSYNGELEPVLYRPTWIPEGYELEARTDSQQLYTYKNIAGAYINYSCYNLIEPDYEHFDFTLNFVDDISEVQRSSVGGSEAKLFTGGSKDLIGGPKALVWKDEENRLLFMLYSPEFWPGDEDFQRMAESVCAQLPE